MKTIMRFFDRKRAATAVTAADLLRSRKLSGQALGQSGEEQAATRRRMEAELDGQRARRDQPPTVGA